MFKDTYPRIIDKDTTNFCNECGPDTSYGLVIPYHEELCRDNQGTADNFCDYTQARFHNNSQLHGTVGTRASRSILDGTNYFERKYNATAFNSRIDKVAFHHQGGFYYDSKPFGVNGITIFMDNNSFSSGKIKIVFDTKDIGIKLYQLNAQKLRGANSETHNCIAFPNSNPCECHGLNIVSDFPQVCNASYPIKFTNQPLLYTPSLSTTYSPKLKAYGGYSSGYISGLFGDKTIPNHPSVGTLLSTVNKKIDPLNPYGCAQNISLNLPNYVKTSWSFTLPSYKSDHADIWAEILEDVDLFHALDCTENYNDDRFGCRPNAGYQRFANSVSINNINLYDKQKKIFISKGGGSASSVSLEIVNPYLKALLGGEYVLYPPIGTFCNNKTIFGGRGDESTSVPIQFSYIPRKQMLNFVTKEQNPMGYLKRGFFHPNSGITYNADYQNSTPFKYDHNFYMQINDLTKTPATSSFNSTKDNISQTNGMYCEYSQVNRSSSDLSRFDSGIVLIGTITKQLKQVLNQINSIDSHKKPRLHLKINDKWYEYKIPNTMGFIKNEQKYIGEPFLFEYVQSEDKAKVSNIMIPIPPKEHIKFNWLYNSPSFKNSENDIDSTTYKKPLIYNDEYYPAAPVKFIKKTKKIIRIPGARAYFYIPEFDNGIQSQATDIKNITLKEQETISSFRTDILLKNGERLRYKGEGSKTDIKSYVYTDYNYLYSNFSNSHIDYTKVSKNGYVFNTHKSCNSSILLADKEYKEYIDPNAKIHTQENKILEKKLYAIYLDNNGNEVDKDYLGHKYLNIYTEFLLEDNIKTTYDYKYIELFNINNIMSLIIYQNIDVLKKEKDLKLYNPLYSSKWSDLINFDQQLEYEITKYHDLYQNYPKSLYKNIFDKFIISNYQPERLNFKLTNSYGNSNLFFILSNNTDEYPLSACIPIYYYIHQKYDVGLNINDGMTTEKTQNYLPFLDVSFPVINKNTNGSKKDITSIAKYNSGTVIFSGIYQNHDSDYDWGAAKNPNKEDLFWINLNISYPLESSLTLKPGEAFYSNTFRIDDTPFKLYSVSSNMGNISSSACLKTFYPTIPSSTTNFDSKVLDFSHYQYSGIDTKPFARFPIYCDTDQLGSCESLKCGMDVIGSLAFSGTYNLYKESSVSINDANADNIPYIISYDGGVYNPLGNSGLQYIQRSELPPNNTLFPTFACDSNVQPRPNLNRYSVLNEEYQSIMSENIVDDHSALVKNTDILANEMLFRILYGEQQKINLKSIDGIDNTISLNDLLKYSDPKIEAKDVYKNIPYDLDIYADSKDREINGSISINGKLAVGKNVSISIENKNISISVVRESGKILARCDVDGYTFDGTIYTEYTDNHNLMVTTGPASAADPTTSYNLLARCKELQQSSFSLSRFVTHTTINVEGGEAVSFPYWPEPLTGYEEGFGQPPAWANKNHPSLALEFRPPCLPAGGGTVVYQTNRGVDPNYADKLPSNCFVFANYSASVNLETYARGTFPGCHPDGSTNFGSWNEGNAENAVGGAIIAQPGAVGHGITTTSPPCGSCNTLSYRNPLTGNNEYSVFSMGFYPPSPGYASNSCECADWGYGYCRNTNNASACICSDLRYDYSEFDYNFEYCRYNITLKGHKRKLNYPQNANTTTISSPCGSTEEGTHITAGSNGSGQQSEDCAWIECLGSPPATYHIYDVVTRANNDLYKPLCPTSLCTITYDNNSITINLVGADSQCITNSIRNSCPKLSVTVPDDSFTVSDQITSLCNGCDVEPNKINMIEQKQNWDIITETRTCVLDYLLTGGNPNENGPVGINAQTFPCGTCGDPAHCRGCKDEEGAGGIGQCGKNAPDSFPWSVCITYGDGEGIVCRNGNGVGEGRSGFPVVGGCDIPVSFPYSNSQAGERIQEYWKSQMRQRWLNTVPCNNHYVPSYNVNDIVEGVVPGSCSDIKYTTVSYPAIKYRATLSDPVVSRSAISYTVAYYTYRYRRPRTVQDILKGDDTVNKCNSVTASCPSNIFNITETYKTAGCDTIPHCYDTNTSSCDDNNYCCRTQRTKYV